MQMCELSEVTNETLLKRHGEVIFQNFHQGINLKSKQCPTILNIIDKMAVCVTLALATQKP